MSSLTLCLWIYALSIVFAMIIAVVIHGLGIFVKSLKLDQPDDASKSIAPSTTDSEREQQVLAVAIAVAHHAKHHPHS